MPDKAYSFRRGLLGATTLTAALSVFAAAAPARAEGQALEFNQAAQPLASALRSYSATADQEIIFADNLVAGRTAPELKGAYTAEGALMALLDGTGLTVRRTATGVLLVQRVSPDPQGSSAAGGGAEVEALIVTAQKREEDIQDVPIAISAFSQEQLERSQVAGGPDLITQVPNMTFTKTNFSSYSIQIRGIGTQAISATTDAAVAVAFNNTPFIRNRFFEQEFYDLQRVEVLRGPQGTLYGRNATAGVVNIISQKPKFAYEAKLSGDLANYNSSRIEGMINIPLAEDVAALRIAGAWTKREGYTVNQLTGDPIDGRDLWSTRVSLRLAPVDTLDINLIWEHFEEDDDRLRSGKQVCKRDVVTEVAGVPTTPLDAPELFVFRVEQEQGTYSQGCKPASMYADESYQAPNGFALPYYHALRGLSFPDVAGFDPYASVAQSRDLRVIESILTPEYRAKADIAELQVSFDLTDDLTITSETAYGTDRVFSFQDYNRFNTREGAFRPFDEVTAGSPARAQSWEGIWDNEGVFCDPQLGCASRLVAADVSTAKASQFSQELRIGSAFDGPFNFSIGANYLRADSEDKYYVFINSLTLWSAMRGGSWMGLADRPPYEVGVSDNSECLLPLGPRLPDPNSSTGLGKCTYYDPNPIGALNDEGHNYFLSKNPYKLMSYAVFGEAYYNVTDALKITAGLRWTVDKKEAPRIPSWIIAEETVGYPVAGIAEQEWRVPTGRLTVDWKPVLPFTNETLVYGSYAHGYKAGGANPPPAGVVILAGDDVRDVIVKDSAAIPKVFEAEYVDAFEVGAKNTLLDGSLTFNAAAFYYDYKDYQISYITERTAVNLNFDAEVWGLEIEADWRALENLRFGFKGGYENTRVADGERAIDVMDRTAGHTDWVVVRPHPARSSNCIMPAYIIPTNDGEIGIPGAVFSGGAGGCEMAWILGRDPGAGVAWDPSTAPPEVNNGEGFYKDLSGNELPNAPHFTATLTADYTIPMPNDWLATLHTDLYYQSEAWTRIFNTEGYDKLKTYTNVNLAAIFTNDAAGWKVMAYVKNVFDRDSITGAFLNSDDTGLTTNVFLTEPRLFGLRVTKEWSGGPWWTGGDPSRSGPFPLTVELGGQIQRQDAPYETVGGWIADEYGEVDTLTPVQHRDLDWGDGRSLEVQYRPGSGPWKLAAGVRYGRVNGSSTPARLEAETAYNCAFAGDYAYLCPLLADDPANEGVYRSQINWSRSSAANRESHEIMDFAVGRDFALGTLENTFSVGLRYVNFNSSTDVRTVGIPDWSLPVGWYAKYESTFTEHDASLTGNREFKGFGPMADWEGDHPLLGGSGTGVLALSWDLAAGVLFGDKTTRVLGTHETKAYTLIGAEAAAGFDTPPYDDPAVITLANVNIERKSSGAVPVLDLSLGLSYEVNRLKLSAGYRWERYFDVLDVGDEKARDADRTIDGPYFKIAVGFGG